MKVENDLSCQKGQNEPYRFHKSVFHLFAGVTDEIQVFGTLEYWLKLRVPMEQAIRLYKERVKALGYLNTSMRDSQVLFTTPSRAPFLALKHAKNYLIFFLYYSDFISSCPQFFIIDGR